MNEPRDSGSSSALNLTPKRIAIAVGGVLLLLFWAANRRPTRISFLVFDATVRVWVALLISGVVGFAMGYLVARRRD